MKCKSCGGELRFQDGVCICQSCGVTYTLDSVYENIDVCICYEETDSAGRRTRDSIIAQEVYRKLEESKVATFYERVSADGMIGRDLEESKLTAIHRAKVIIVLGTSVENFSAIETKYGEYFVGKIVIPFCVDTTPNAMPKTLSKIQAISYSAIGWEKDLIEGIYNILGRAQVIDTGSLYSRRKNKIVIVSIIAAVLVVVGVVVALFLLKPNVDSNGTEGTMESTEKPLTQKEIYDNATELLNQGNFVEALELFAQIPDHPNSKNMINQIYSKYEGYYQKDNISIHLEILDNNRVEVELRIISADNIVSTNINAAIQNNQLVANYTDNNNIFGKMNMTLNNDGLVIRIESENVNINTSFKLSEKTDQSIVQISKEMLFNWLENEYTFSKIRDLGYDIEFFRNMDVEGPDYGGENVVYKITDTDVYLSMIRCGIDKDGNDFQLDDAVLIGVAAPAEMIEPSLIGKKCMPDFDDEIIYWPNAFLCYTLGWSYFDDLECFDSTETTISNNTMLGIAWKKVNNIVSWEYMLYDAIEECIKFNITEKFDLTSDKSIELHIVAENKSKMLYKAEITLSTNYNTNTKTQMWLWCKFDKINKASKFAMEEKSITINMLDSDADFLFSDRYFPPEEFAKEFPDVFNDTDSQQDNAGFQENSSNLQQYENFSEDPMKKTFSNWKEAYLYVVDYAKEEHVFYELVYVDDDSIPELYMSGDCEAAGCGVYSFKNGKVYEIRLGRLDGGRYIEKSGIVYNHNGNMGYYYTDIYKLGSDGFVTTFTALMEEEIIQREDEDEEYEYVYSIDGIVVSEEEYTEAIALVFDIERSIPLGQNAVEYSAIKNQIGNYSA